MLAADSCRFFSLQNATHASSCCFVCRDPPLRKGIARQDGMGQVRWGSFQQPRCRAFTTLFSRLQAPRNPGFQTVIFSGSPVALVRMDRAHTPGEPGKMALVRMDTAHTPGEPGKIMVWKPGLRGACGREMNVVNAWPRQGMRAEEARARGGDSHPCAAGGGAQGCAIILLPPPKRSHVAARRADAPPPPHTHTPHTTHTLNAPPCHSTTGRGGEGCCGWPYEACGGPACLPCSGLLNPKEEAGAGARRLMALARIRPSQWAAWYNLRAGDALY